MMHIVLETACNHGMESHWCQHIAKFQMEYDLALESIHTYKVCYGNIKYFQNHI